MTYQEKKQTGTQNSIVKETKDMQCQVLINKIGL